MTTKKTTTKKVIKADENKNISSNSEQLKCIFELDYGNGVPDLKIGEIIIDKKDKEDIEGIKNAFLKNILENDIKLFGTILIAILSSGIKKKNLNSLLKVEAVKKNKKVNIFIKEPHGKNFIKTLTTNNIFNIKPTTKKINLEEIVVYLINENDKNSFDIPEMFLKILTHNIPKDKMESDDFVNLLAKEFQKILSIKFEEITTKK